MKVITVFIFVLSAFVPCFSEILNVPSAEFPNIQTAIDSSTTGDTILVDQGTYTERIDFLGKNIIVASRYLTESDTSLITSTVLDGQGGGSVVVFQSGEDSTTQLIGFTIQNGFSFPGDGAGIRCINGSNPKFSDLIIRKNISGVGAGIFVYNDSHIKLERVRIQDNSGIYAGGGIFCDRNSSIKFMSGEIKRNTANEDGGGIYVNDSSYVFLNDVLIAQNSSYYTGGALFASFSRMDFVNTNIRENSSFQGGGMFFENCYETVINNCKIERNVAAEEGGGLFALESGLVFQLTRIHHNQAYASGGGIFTAYSTLMFDENEKSDIFLNFAGLRGNDFYAESDTLIPVTLDTTTILPVTEYQAFPSELFRIDAQAAKVVATGNELYVSPAGSDNNDGLSDANPLATIAYALTKIAADSSNPGTIYLAPGTYGIYQNDDFFPLNMRNFTTLAGNNPREVILDGSFIAPILGFSGDRGAVIEKMTLQNGYGFNGGAAYMENSQANFYQTIFQENSADLGGAIYLENNSRAELLNGTMVANPGFGVMYLRNSAISVVNSIFWETSGDALVFDASSDPNSAAVAYSDIQGGQEGLLSTTNGSLYWLSGNIDLNPLFEDSLNYDFRLQAESPCIDAGRQDTILYYNSDLDSLKIPVLVYNDNAPDMGAIESGEPNRVTAGPRLPKQFILFQNYPNPFNPLTTIKFSLPQLSDIKLRIYNTLGQLIQIIEQKGLAPGVHEIVFDGTGISSGIYYYVVSAGNYTANRKMLLIK